MTIAITIGTTIAIAIAIEQQFSKQKCDDPNARNINVITDRVFVGGHCGVIRSALRGEADSPPEH